jgi:hypothetical protein
VFIKEERQLKSLIEKADINWTEGLLGARVGFATAPIVYASRARGANP